MKYEEIEKLVRLVADTGVAEVEVTRSGVHVRVSRILKSESPPGHSGATVFAMPPGAGGWPGPSAGVQPTGGPAAGATAAPEDAEEGLHVITASMVGTFYRRPNPDAPPFAKEGDVIKKGQVVCILEAMKILNEIESDVSGTVVKVFPEDSQPVEFGEKLMAIRPL